MFYGKAELEKVLRLLDDLAADPEQLRPSRIAKNNRLRWLAHLAMYYDCETIASLKMRDLVGIRHLKAEFIQYRTSLGLPPLPTANEDLSAVVPPFRGKQYRFDEEPAPVLKRPLNKREIWCTIGANVYYAAELYPDRKYDPEEERAQRKYEERLLMRMD